MADVVSINVVHIRHKWILGGVGQTGSFWLQRMKSVTEGIMTTQPIGFIGLYEKAAGDPTGLLALEAWRDKNVQLLRDSGKNLDMLRCVYGETS